MRLGRRRGESLIVLGCISAALGSLITVSRGLRAGLVGTGTLQVFREISGLVRAVTEVLPSDGMGLQRDSSLLAPEVSIWP